MLSTAVDIEAWEDFAEITRTALLIIDKDSTKRSFANDVKWNAAYYRLAQDIECLTAGRHRRRELANAEPSRSHRTRPGEGQFFNGQIIGRNSSDGMSIPIHAWSTTGGAALPHAGH